MIGRVILVLACSIVFLTSSAILLVMPSPMVFADQVARLVYLAFGGWLILVMVASAMVLLLIATK